jgi:hypothetical protein
LALDDLFVGHADRLVVLAPGGDAAHDEQLLPRLYEAEASRLSYQLASRPRLGDALLQLRLLIAKLSDFGLARLQLMVRVQVRLRRLPVEERNEHDPAQREQPCRSEPKHQRPDSAELLRSLRGTSYRDDARQRARDENLRRLEPRIEQQRLAGRVALDRATRRQVVDDPARREQIGDLVVGDAPGSVSEKLVNLPLPPPKNS